MSGGWGRRRPLIAVLTVAAALVVAGCGKAKYEYVTNADEHTYFKVPTTYTEVVDGADDLFNVYLGLEPDSQAAHEFRAVRWSKVYDASTAPDVNHVISMHETPSPVVYSVVQHIPPGLQNALSFDLLRDLIWPPVTEKARQNADTQYQEAVQAGYQGPPFLSNFELLSDSVVTTPEGFRGVRVIYNWQFADGSVNTFDRTTLMSNDASVVYILLVRCSAQCYRARSAEFNDIATSFTVRSKTA